MHNRHIIIKMNLDCNRLKGKGVLRTVDTNRDLFWRLLEAEHPRAESFCRRLAGDLARGDDLYQDSLLQALRKFDRLRNPAAFKPWLYRIIVNTCASQRRAAWWKKRVRLTNEIVDSLASDDPAPEYEAKRWIAKALAALSPEDRALITLFELEGWSIAELANLNGKSPGTIKSRLSRAREKMREEIESQLMNEEKTLKRETNYALPQSKILD